jgi:hypothetical protein
MNHRRRYSLLHGACSSSVVHAEGHSIMLSRPQGHGGLAKQVMDEVVSIIHVPTSVRKPQQFMRPATFGCTNANRVPGASSRRFYAKTPAEPIPEIDALHACWKKSPWVNTTPLPKSWQASLCHIVILDAPWIGIAPPRVGSKKSREIGRKVRHHAVFRKQRDLGRPSLTGRLGRRVALVALLP